MRRVHRITGLAFLLFALFVGYVSTGLTYYTRVGPGPGFFPLWLSIILGVLAIAMIVFAGRSAEEPLPDDFFADFAGYAKSGIAFISLITAAAFFTRLGFVVTMAIFHFVLLSVFARRNILETIVLTFLGSFGVYYLFAHLLGTPLPTGIYAF